MDNLLFLQFLQQSESEQKDQTLKQTTNPFDDFDKALESRVQNVVQLAKITAKKLLEEVGKLAN